MTIRKLCSRCGGAKDAPVDGQRPRYCDACLEIVTEERRARARTRTAAWQSAHPGHYAAWYREHMKDPEVAEKRRERARQWRQDNPARDRELHRRWAENNPDQTRAFARDYQARKRGTAFVESVDPLVVLEMDDGVCGICGGDVDPFDYHVDHIVPLSRGGEHSYANTQVAHPLCNQRKGARTLDEIMG